MCAAQFLQQKMEDAPQVIIVYIDFPIKTVLMGLISKLLCSPSWITLYYGIIQCEVESEAHSLSSIGKSTDFRSRLLNCLIVLCVFQYALRKVQISANGPHSCRLQIGKSADLEHLVD